MIQTDLEDIFLWSDGTWCYRYEGWEMNHMSDDYEVVKFGTERWDQVLQE